MWETTEIGAISRVVVSPFLPNIFESSSAVLRVFDLQLNALDSIGMLQTAESISAPVQLLDGSWAQFVLGNTGLLTRFDLALTNGEVTDLTESWTQPSVFQPPGCEGGGALSTLRLADASASVAAAWNADQVFVGNQLAGACTGFNQKNEVISFEAENGVVNWSFNGLASYEVDRVYGMVMDAPGGRLYAATDRTYSTSQDSLFALNLLAGLDWSVNAGRIQTTPAQSVDRLYVANLAGQLLALEKDDGSQAWSLGSGGIPFLVDPVHVDESGSSVIYTLDFFGKVRRAEDNGLSGSFAWTTQLPLTNGSTLPVSALAVDEVAQRVYAADDNGVIHVLNALTGEILECRSAGQGDAEIANILLMPQSLYPGGLLATSTYPANRLSLYSTTSVNAPYVVSPIPNVNLLRVDEGPLLHVADLNTRFADPDGDPLVFTVQSMNPTDVVDVALSGPGNQALTVTALKHGYTEITIRASDLDSGTGEGFVDDTFLALTMGLLSEASIVPGTLYTNRTTSVDVGFTTPSELGVGMRINTTFPVGFNAASAALGVVSAAGASLQVDFTSANTVRLIVTEGTIPANSAISYVLESIQTPASPGNPGDYRLVTLGMNLLMDRVDLPGDDFIDFPELVHEDGFETEN